ncbi:hypothetical protein GVAV_002110 [Gurleya vavrai]
MAIIQRKNNRFIDSTDEILKCYESSVSKRARLKLSDEQVGVLEMSFWEENHPSTKIKENLSKTLDIPSKNIQIWFQNRRARQRSEKLEYESKFKKRLHDKYYINKKQENNIYSPVIEYSKNNFVCYDLCCNGYYNDPRVMLSGKDNLNSNFIYEDEQFKTIKIKHFEVEEEKDKNVNK